MAWIKRSMFLKLSLLILFSTSLVLLIVMGVSNYEVSNELLEDQGRYYNSLVALSSTEINTQFYSAEKAVEEVAALFKVIPNKRDGIINLLKDMLQKNPNLTGSAVALAGDQDFSKAGYQILYCWNEKGNINTIDRSFPESDYQDDWFYLPYYLKKPVWTDPYVDPEINKLMVTYAVPILSNDKVTAVITCDLSLDYITSLLSDMPLGNEGSPVVVSQFGRNIVHPNPDYILKETLFSIAENAASSEDYETMMRISATLLKEKKGSLRFKRVGTEDIVWLYCNKIESTNWGVGFIIPEAQILAPIRQMNIKLVITAVIGIILLLIPAFIVSLTITKPLKKLSDATGKLAVGNFEIELPYVKKADEIGRLVNSFRMMKTQLQDYIQNLAATTAEKEKIASELSIAEKIQHSILPKLFPPFPQRMGLDIFASLNSAKEVGGDLFDFMLLDDDHLYICIGDVSGKGVPASLFMAVGKTLMKSTIQTTKDPAKALFHVNNELADGNDANMFITLFCGILDLNTNELIYGNAGHNPPYLIQKENLKEFEYGMSPPLGAMRDIKFQNNRITIPDNAQVILYTDGVTEAMDTGDNLYGEKRLEEVLKNNDCKTAEKRIETVIKDLKKYTKGADQSDDITMLCFSHFRDQRISKELNSPTASITLVNRREEFARMVTWLEDISKKLNWDNDLLFKMNLVMEEWVVNLVSYAFKEDDDEIHEIELKLWQTEKQIVINIIDDGFEYDPTMKADPDINAPIEEREIGGLGIMFIKNNVDEWKYERKDNKNSNLLIKKLN